MHTERKTAVVINDDIVQLKLTSSQLEKHGLKVLSSQSAEEALRSITDNSRIDLIVTDLYMPGIDGWRLCRLLRSQEYKRFNKTPILVISATFSGVDAESITSALGADAFLSVPCKQSDLLECVDALLQGKSFSPRIHVLIIDDDPIQSKILEKSLESRGFVLHIADTGEKGRELYNVHRPQVVVLDYYLPDMTGDKLLGEFTKPDSYSTVIMITASEDPEIALQLIRQGAAGYIRKPFSPEYLVELFEKARRERSWLRADSILDERTRQLHESESRYHRMVNAVTAYTYSVKLEEGVPVSTEHSKGCLQVTGYGYEEANAIKDFWQKIAHPDNSELLKRTILSVYAGEDVPPLEHRVIQKDGSIRWVCHTFAPYRAQDGKVLSYDGIVDDITHRKLAEQALHDRVEMEQLITTISNRFINLKADETDHEIEAALQMVGEYAGVDRSYVFGFSEDKNGISNTHEWCKEGISPQIDNLQDIPVDEFPWWMSQLNRFECIHIPCVADLPAEAAAEKNILEAQDIKSLIVVPMVGSGGLKGFIGFDSVFSEKTWGEGESPLLGTLASIFANAFERKQSEEEKNNLLMETTKRTKEIACIYNVSKLLRNPSRSLEETLQGAVELIPPGWQYPEIACARIVFEGQIYKSGNYGQSPWNLTSDIKVSGVWVGVVEVSYLEKKPEVFEGPFLKEERNLIDVLAREIGLSVEFRQLEEQLKQSQKMEAIGILAGGIAHDFNNLLTGILGYSNLALDNLSEDEPMRRDIEEITKAGESAAMLTNQLLAFSRKQMLDPKIINLNDTVNQMGKMLRRVIGEDIELITTLAPNIENVKADPAQIEQVIMNLAVNARDAMPDGGKLLIETTNIKFSEEYEAKHAGVEPGSYALLAISDTGTGMDEETRTHLFEPFFTTKEKGRGTGLGLSTVYGIVKQSEGYITLYSEPGQGSTFKIYLPCVDKPVESAEQKHFKDDILRGTETILLVEDEPMVRAFAKRVLEGKGYTVLEASNGDEAISALEKCDEQIHLLITDVVMPGMSGAELAERLTITGSDIKVLFMSGYTEDAIVHRGVLDEDKEFIQKPFTIEALTLRVRAILDSPST